MGLQLRSDAAPALLLLMLAIGCFPGLVNGLLKEGLYVSNKTDILFVFNPRSLDAGGMVSVYKQDGRITGLAYDKCNEQLFWSNVDVFNRGIYRGSLDADGKVDNVTKIVGTDVLEVSGLTYDWVSKHLYWTDSRKKTIEVSDADGGNRRILVMTGRGSPRGIYADPINGYLFWTDQALKHIARSNLDGSDQKIIAAQGVSLPNQVVVYNNTVYWVDSFNKTFESCDLVGGRRLTKPITLANGQHIFGLAVHDRTAYITNWVNGQLIAIDTDGGHVTRGTQNLGKEELFSAVYVKSIYQPKRNDPCETKGCAALCLPVEMKSENKARCSCPSFGGKTINNADGKTCTTPSGSVLLVAMADSGYVGYFDASDQAMRDFYVVGRSLRPVAVTYDPITKNVFWSDVRERSVHMSNIDGTHHQILLRSQQGIGLVEGMLVDVARRQLYYTNIGSVLIEDTPYSWHRIETFSLRNLTNVKVKTIVTTADKPRGLALDSPNGHLYYTDWGNRASIVRVNLDGSNPTLIRTGLDNPNGIALLNNRIFFVDSHFKSRQEERNGGGGDVGRSPKNGSLYSMDLNGDNLINVLLGRDVQLRTPFGLTVASSQLYVGDWETENLILLNSTGTLSRTVLQRTSGLMALFFSPLRTDIAGTNNNCVNKNCGDICLSKTKTEASCSCNSYGGKTPDSTGTSCSVPSKFLVVADMNSIKIVSQDDKDSHPYIAVQGNPFTSNFVGLAVDDANRIVYYSDISGKMIKALHLSNMTSTDFYRINEVIDGMVFHDRSLYWTDYTNGRISRLNLSPRPDQQLRHDILVRNLNRPRGIRIHNNFVYWTEWGGTPKISRKQLDPRNSKPEQIYSSLRLVWPNGISIYMDKMYVIDGSTRKIYRCEMSRNDNCQPINGTEDVMKHAYDLWTKDGSVFYYSDWKTGSIKAFDANKPGRTWTVVGGLMRPTQFHISPLSRPASTSCSSGTCSSGTCVPLWFNHGCDCQGKIPTYDLRNCTSESTTSCSYGGTTYVPERSFSPTPCVSCRCLGRTSWSHDPVYNDSVCERISCPKLSCAATEIQRPSPNQCCPTCSSCRIRITNCPERPLNFTLPRNQGYVVYDFLPTVRDCLGLAREVSTKRLPNEVGAIYRRGETNVKVISWATKENGNAVDDAECQIKVVVRDVTPPIITCPPNITAYLTGEQTSVEVKWNPPQVTENDEIEGQPVASQLWGSQFSEGIHTVTYTVRDKSGFTSRCSFQVTIIKLKTSDACKIPQIDNAQLQCLVGTFLQCTIDSCQSGYEFKYKKALSLHCINGRWDPLVTDAAFDRICIKRTRSSVIGSLEITAQGSCADGTVLKYTSDFLYDAFQRDHVRKSAQDLTLDVKAKGCNGPSKDLIVDVNVVGRSSESDSLNLTKAINDILEDIQNDLEREFIRVPLNSPSGPSIAHDLSIVMVNATSGCLPGQINDNSECEVCDVGTYANKTCIRCPPDSYNDERGQSECKPCPDGTKSGTGSYIIDQCIEVSSDSNNFLLIVAVLVCLGVFLLLLLVIAIVCLKRHSASKGSFEHAKVNMNKVFDPDLDYDCTYDKIADPVEEAVPTNKNNYESLETAIAGGAGATANTYDRIVCNEDDDKAESCREGKMGDCEDGNSTPPYLEPVDA